MSLLYFDLVASIDYVMSIGAESGDVHSVVFNQKKSEAEYADLLWKLASS